MISRFKSLIKNVVGISTTKVECSIDEKPVDCKTFTQPYVGVLAPPILKNDVWFGEPIMSEQQKEIAEKSKEFLDSSKAFDDPIVTQIVPAPEFYKAEDYHQKYFKKQGF